MSRLTLVTNPQRHPHRSDLSPVLPRYDGMPILHSMDMPVQAGPSHQWWARCACGWVSDPQETVQGAASLRCAVDEAEVAGHRNGHRLNVALYDDAHFERMFPRRPEQV